MDAIKPNVSQIGNVVLLHGLGRTYRIMNQMASYLEQQGYNTHNIDYPSTQFNIETAANFIYEKIQSLYAMALPLHFVGHSLGAIIIRYLLTRYRPPNLARVVMLAPPNHGTLLVNCLSKIPPIRKIFGPAFIQLVAGKKGIAARLPAVDYETGVIAGDHAVDFLFWLLLHKPNDGKVTVESTCVQGMQDHVVLPVSHPFVPQNRYVKRQTAVFLTRGRFI